MNNILFKISLSVVSCFFYGTAFAEIPAPVSLLAPAECITPGSITLLWEKHGAQQAGTTYLVYCNGRNIGQTTRCNFRAAGLLPSTHYTFFIRSRSPAGELSNPCLMVKLSTPAVSKVISITDFGAKGDGHTLNTKAIQQAIDACTPGGTVWIPAGLFLSGALYLKSNMTLRLAKNAELRGSRDARQYEPLMLNRFEGWELNTLASLLNAGRLDRSGAYHITNLRICGEGKISGGGSELAKGMIKLAGMRGRGRLICIMNADHVDIQGLTITDSPCWTIHYIYSRHVTLHDLSISSIVRNGDGVDPDSSTDSNIFNCSFSTGDDCIAVKSGKNPEGYFIAKPTKNLRISDCDFTRGNALAIGSEMSGGVSNVLIENCKLGNLYNGLQIKATKDRGGYIEYIVVRDCNLLKINIMTDISYNNDGKPAPVSPRFRNFQFLNLDMTAAKPDSTLFCVNGFTDKPHYTSNLKFENILLPAGSAVYLKHCKQLFFKNVLGADGKKPLYHILQSQLIHY